MHFVQPTPLFENWNALCKNFNPEAIYNERLPGDFGENAYLYRETFKPPVAVIDTRETIVFHMKIAAGEGQHVLVATSVDNGQSVGEGQVRAELKYLVHMCEPTIDDPNRTHIVASYASDPCGSIPGPIKNKIMKKRVKLYEGLVPQLNNLRLNS